jgi:hypothetical protein
MSTIVTNRDLYLAIADLVRRQTSPRSLEEYLRALWATASRQRQQPAVPLNTFVELLAAGFTEEGPPFDERWRDRYPDDAVSPTGFEGWEARILRQIVDLRELNEQGQLRDELRYLGINSPRGSRWYNYDPRTFLECAVEGTYRGWQPEDDTGRQYVSGQVAVVGADGNITSCDPQELDNPITPISEVTWESFTEFLGEGQWYE